MNSFDSLSESAKQFKQKKSQCASYVDRAEDLALAYEKDFPPQEKLEGKSLSDELQDLGRKIKNDRLKILVAGQFKQGKSTLVNAMLGEEVLPAYSTPCTAVITEIAYGDSKKAVIKFKEQINELPKGLAQEAKAHIGSRKTDIPDLVIESANFGSRLTNFLVIPEDDEPQAGKDHKDAVAESPYACCRVYWPLELCKNDVEIIDSPGLNEASARDETTFSYVPKADMILHVLNATQLFGMPDKQFLDKVLLRGKPSLIFLVNRFDQLNKNEDKNKVQDRAWKLLPPYTAYGRDGIFFVSSQMALEARIDKDGDKFRDSGFADFEDSLAKIIEKDRIKIKLDENLKNTCGLIDNMANNQIPELLAKLDANGEELKKKYDAAQKEFASLDDRKAHILKTVKKGLSEINSSLNTSLRMFFRDFAAQNLAEHIAGTSLVLGLIDLTFNKEEAINNAINELKADMLEGMQKDLMRLLSGKSAEIRGIVADMNDSVKRQLRDFRKELTNIRTELDSNTMQIRPVSIDGKALVTAIDGDLDDVLFDDVLNGVLAGGAFWGIAEFLAIFGGPFGWFMLIGTAIATAILSKIFKRETIEDQIKSRFTDEVDRALRKEADVMAKQLTDKIMVEFETKTTKLRKDLERTIIDLKAPIESAIKMLNDNTINIGEKKKQLEDYRQKFANLLKDGHSLQASI